MKVLINFHSFSYKIGSRYSRLSIQIQMLCHLITVWNTRTLNFFNLDLLSIENLINKKNLIEIFIHFIILELLFWLESAAGIVKNIFWVFCSRTQNRNLEGTLAFLLQFWFRITWFIKMVTNFFDFIFLILSD